VIQKENSLETLSVNFRNKFHENQCREIRCQKRYTKVTNVRQFVILEQMSNYYRGEDTE
jgi:hypothetical protein